MINYQSWLYSRLMIEGVGSSHAAAAPLTGTECKGGHGCVAKGPERSRGFSPHLSHFRQMFCWLVFHVCAAFFFWAQAEAEGLLQAVFKDDLFICDVIDYSAFDPLIRVRASAQTTRQTLTLTLFPQILLSRTGWWGGIWDGWTPKPLNAHCQRHFLV